MKRVEIDVKYYRQGEFSHSYRSSIAQTKYYCPRCGERGVWVDKYGGDYYVGPSWYCPSCSAVFTMPSEELYADGERVDDRVPNQQERQILEAIREAL